MSNAARLAKGEERSKAGQADELSRSGRGVYFCHGARHWESRSSAAKGGRTLAAPSQCGGGVLSRGRETTVFGRTPNVKCLTRPKLTAGGIRVAALTLFAAADASLATTKTVAAEASGRGLCETV